MINSNGYFRNGVGIASALNFGIKTKELTIEMTINPNDCGTLLK
jgi:hypothetical protein